MGEAFKYQSSWHTENILTSNSVLALGSGSFLKLNQTTPQTVSGGVPIFNSGITANGLITGTGGQQFTGTLTAVPTVTGLSVTPTYDGGGYFAFNAGNAYKVYAIIAGAVSATACDSGMVYDNGSFTGYHLVLSWTAVTGATGYRIIKYYDDNYGWYGDDNHWIDTATNSYDDTGNNFTASAPTLTPTSYYTKFVTLTDTAIKDASWTDGRYFFSNSDQLVQSTNFYSDGTYHILTGQPFIVGTTDVTPFGSFVPKSFMAYTPDAENAFAIRSAGKGVGLDTEVGMISCAIDSGTGLQNGNPYLTFGTRDVVGGVYQGGYLMHSVNYGGGGGGAAANSHFGMGLHGGGYHFYFGLLGARLENSFRSYDINPSTGSSGSNGAVFNIENYSNVASVPILQLSQQTATVGNTFQILNTSNAVEFGITAGGNILMKAGTDIRPSANSTTAINIAQADGTDFVTFDTTNKRVGIGGVTPQTAFELYNSANAGAYNAMSIRSNAGSSSQEGRMVWTHVTSTPSAAIGSQPGSTYTAGDLRFYTSTSGVLPTDAQMILKNTGFVGIGTLVPSQKLSIVGGNFDIANTATLGAESLTNPNLTGGTSWTATNDCTLVNDRAEWAYSGGLASTLTQASATLATAGVGSRWYSFTYTIVSNTNSANLFITNSFAETQTALNINPGTRTTVFRSAATPGDFVITGTMTAGKAIVLDTMTLKEVQGGDIVCGGYISGGVVGQGLKVFSPGDCLITNKLSFTQTDKNEYIDSLADGYLDIGATTGIRFNNAAADTDVVTTWAGTSNSGVLTWMEDEDQFKFTDRIQTDGGIIGKITNAIDTYGVLVSDETVICNKATAFTVTLPTAVVGQRFTIKNIGAGAVTVDGASTDLIDGVANQVLGQWDCIQIQCYVANNWGVI